jgi:hypothetical protein
MAHGALDADNRLRLLALAAGLRHNAEIGQPGRCFSAYGHKFGISHLVDGYLLARASREIPPTPRVWIAVAWLVATAWQRDGNATDRD